MKNFFLSVAFLFTVLPVFSQKVTEKEAITYVKQLITNGKHSYEVLEKEIPADLREILVRYRNSLAENRDWYAKYQKDHGDQTPLPYDEKFGVTSDEYVRINRDLPNLKTKTKSIENIIVTNTSDSIKFAGDGPFTIFDAVAFDVKKSILYIDWQQIPYSGEVSETAQSSLAGEWKGHMWRLETGTMQNAVDTRGDYGLFEISFGKTTDGKTVMRFKAISIEEGATMVNATVSGYLR